MADNIQRGEDGLPITTEKELAAMEKLFSEEQYQLKEPSGFLRPARKGLVNPEFIMRTLDEFVRHLHAFKTATKKMIPLGAPDSFFEALLQKNQTAEGIIKMAISIDVKGLNEMLNMLQESARNVSVAAMQPFIKTLYKSLIRIYYLDPEYTSSCLMDAYRLAAERFVPSNAEALRSNALSAVQETKYIYDKIFPLTYPLVLRMTSPIMMSEKDLFYKNGSKVLAWLDVQPDEILFPVESSVDSTVASEQEGQDAQEEPLQVPESVSEGLEILEQLFPQAGWEKILKYPEEKSDFAPYFLKPLQLTDTFIQLNPDHPLHFAMLLFLILSELFQGLRHVSFSTTATEDSIYDILDDWVMYGVSVFEKTFGGDLKAYTHQVYSQPDFARSGYASRLIANMYSLIRQYFLPFYDMRFYPFQKTLVDRLPALYPRVSRLHKMLETSLPPHASSDGGIAEATNASDIYRFDIPNVASRHLDALCGGSRSRRRTNTALIRFCTSILAVLDWWINDSKSPAYKANVNLIYRTTEGESGMPAFGIDGRTDTEEIFKNSLKHDAPAS